MTPEEALNVAIEVFMRSCSKLQRIRNPRIYQKDSNELLSGWFQRELDNLKVRVLGANQHPDCIIGGVGFELKSLKYRKVRIQFNSTIPCGGFKHNGEMGECYYVVARYDKDGNSGYLQDLTILDGDFFNNNRDRAFLHQNHQETNFGDYGDGVCRHRKMYSFPNCQGEIPGISLISKFEDLADRRAELLLERVYNKTTTEGQIIPFYIYRHRLLV